MFKETYFSRTRMYYTAGSSPMVHLSFAPVSPLFVSLYQMPFIFIYATLAHELIKEKEHRHLGVIPERRIT